MNNIETITRCFQLPYFVGLRGACDFEQSQSGLCINDLPGISLRKLSAVATDEDIKGAELYKRAERAALIELVNDFLGRVMAEGYRFNYVLESERVGYLKNWCFVDPFFGHRGVKIERCTSDRYVRTRIDYIELYSKYEIVKKLYIHEMGEDCIEREIKLKRGKNRIPVNYTACTEEVYIYMNTSDICLGNTKRHDDSCGCYHTCSGDVRVTGIERGLEDCDWDNCGSLNGFMISTSLVCTPEDFICDNLHTLATAAYYKIGIQLMTESMVSDRANPLVRNSKEDASFLLALWLGGEHNGQYFEGEYKKAMKLAVASAKNTIDTDSRCFSCVGSEWISAVP